MGRKNLSKELKELEGHIDRVEDDAQQKHVDNLERFSNVEKSVSYISGELKIIISLLIINGGVNVYLAMRK